MFLIILFLRYCHFGINTNESVITTEKQRNIIEFKKHITKFSDKTFSHLSFPPQDLTDAGKKKSHPKSVQEVQEEL